MKSEVERRQFRRAEIDVPVAIRQMSAEPSSPATITGQVKNLSLSGVYCYTTSPCALKPGESVSCTVAIPPEQARLFPFTRIAGRGWVVRMDPILSGRRAGENPTTDMLIGLAVAFTPDVTALGTIIH